VPDHLVRCIAPIIALNGQFSPIEPEKHPWRVVSGMQIHWIALREHVAKKLLTL